MARKTTNCYGACYTGDHMKKSSDFLGFLFIEAGEIVLRRSASEPAVRTFTKDQLEAVSAFDSGSRRYVVYAPIAA